MHSFYAESKFVEIELRCCDQIFGSWLGTALSFHYIFAYRPDIHCALLRASVAPVCSAGCGSAFFGAGAAPAGSDDAAAVCAAASVPAQLLVYRMLLSLLIAGLCKVVGKMIPSALFDWLFRSGVLRPHPEELRDGFGQAVPRHKAYYFEVPVRLINYGSLGIATVVLCPLCWQLLLPDGDANH